MASQEPIVQTKHLSKDYGPIRVVSDMSLSLHRGSIHALLGENGAGKSTVINMLAGVIQPSEGKIFIQGKPVLIRSVKEGQQAGIVALPQELSLVPTLNASENIYLGVPQSKRTIFANKKKRQKQAAKELAKLGQTLPLHIPVGELSAVQQTMVAICRALVRKAKVLILDEPTAALTDTETDQLFTVLRQLQLQGTAILYVSHRLEEVFELADTATVMRNGMHVWTKPITSITTQSVIEAMIGRKQTMLFPTTNRDNTQATLDTTSNQSKQAKPTRSQNQLSLHQVSSSTIKQISFVANGGEVLGIAGLAGSGRSELLHCIAGAIRPSTGKITLNHVDITNLSLKKTMQAGISLVPEERRSQGLIISASITDNIALANLALVHKWGVVSRRKEKAMASKQAAELQIKAVSVNQPVEQLSGGNQQKVVLAKCLENTPKVLLLDEPTKGIDVGTKAEIYQLIRNVADQGVIIIVVSSEIPELIGLCDTIAVLHEGSLSGIVPAHEATESSILHLSYNKPTSTALPAHRDL